MKKSHYESCVMVVLNQALARTLYWCYNDVIVERLTGVLRKAKYACPK